LLVKNQQKAATGYRATSDYSSAKIMPIPMDRLMIASKLLYSKDFLIISVFQLGRQEGVTFWTAWLKMNLSCHLRIRFLGLIPRQKKSGDFNFA